MMKSKTYSNDFIEGYVMLATSKSIGMGGNIILYSHDSLIQLLVLGKKQGFYVLYPWA